MKYTLPNMFMPNISFTSGVVFAPEGNSKASQLNAKKLELVKLQQKIQQLQGVKKPTNKPKNPGKFRHTSNQVVRGRQRGILVNNVTKARKFTPFFSNPKVKDKVAAKAKAMLASLNKPYAKYQEELKAFKKKNTNYTNAQKAIKAANKQIEKLNTQIQTLQAEAAAEMQTAQAEMATTAYTDPASLVTETEVSEIDPNAPGTTVDAGTGQVGPAATMKPVTTGKAVTAKTPGQIGTETYEAQETEADITTAMEGVQGAQGAVDPQALAQAATMDPMTSAVQNLQAEQSTAIMMNNPVQRQIQEGELITGAADAATAAAFTEQVQAATAQPSQQTMVQEQLSNLMQDFEGGQTPAWAAGAMRAAMGQMAARGLGASSIAGQATVQAAMESALPIAMADAQTQAQFEMQNLSNRQQRAMLAAQQRAQFIGQEFDQAFQARVQNASRIADIADMNFTAEQQVALENSRAANTMQLANLNNRQAMVMAQAASISQLEQQNLSNEQQAAVQNAQAFLEMDMANLSNQQQAEMFKAQSIAQSIFTDAAATNAAAQFNAASENQTRQFMANLRTQVSQFNATQRNATKQFNAGQKNAARQFNAQVRNQRNQFNATNRLVVAQANAQWRQNVATINTAAQNQANMEKAKNVNAITTAALDQLWQRERDLMDYAFKATEDEKQRAFELILADKKYAEYAKARDDAEETSRWETLAYILFR